MNDYAYVTLLSSNTYILGVLCTYNTWKKTNSIYPFYVMVTPNIKEEVIDILKENKILNIIRVKEWKIPSNIGNGKEADRKLWDNAWAKFNCFGLSQFKKIIYIDSDVLFLKNIDNLLEKNNFSAVREYSPSYYRAQRIYFNSGLIIIEPSEKLLDNFKQFLINFKSDSFLADQDLLEFYLPEWKNKKELHLDIEYNYLVPFIKYKPYSDIKKEDVKLAHFLFLKPFTGDIIHYSDEQKYFFTQYNEQNQFLISKYKWTQSPICWGGLSALYC
jgi:glycogenin